MLGLSCFAALVGQFVAIFASYHLFCNPCYGARCWRFPGQAVFMIKMRLREGRNIRFSKSKGVQKVVNIVNYHWDKNITYLTLTPDELF